MPAETDALTVSVVIPVGGRSKHLPELVDRLLADAAHEVLLVDDRPADAPRPPVLTRTDPRLRVLQTGGLGPAPARQAGVESAAGEVVLLLDDDVVPEPGLVAGHGARHAAAAGLVVVGTMPVDRDLDAPGPAFPRELYARDYERRIAAYARDPSEVLSHLWAGNVSLRRADALAVGLVSDRYRGYRHEDQEFGLRCRAAGLRGVFAPELAASHRYERAPEAFFADARSQGREQAVLRELHPDVATPLRAEAFLAGVPTALRPVVGLARRPRGAAALRALLRGAIALSGRAGWSGIQLRAAQLRRRVEQIDGACRP